MLHFVTIKQSISSHWRFD